ncbi:hypothetical protein ACO1O0_006017 [Amphichorda felina]
MGNQNCHAEITFQDGVKWLARFRLARTSSPPQQVLDCILRSEAATMIFLQQHTCVPAPKVFDWASGSDPKNPLKNSATPAQREKIMQQLADIFLELGKHPFDAMGSLLSQGDAVSIQGLAHQSTFQVGKGPIGPFSSSLEGSRAVIKSYLTMIASGEIDAACPVDTYLAHRFRLDIVADALGHEDGASAGRFFLKHPDDKGDHILVNDSFDIVGIIDWEWTQAASKPEAFCSPCMMWPIDDSTAAPMSWLAKRSG